MALSCSAVSGNGPEKKRLLCSKVPANRYGFPGARPNWGVLSMIKRYLRYVKKAGKLLR
jgi:hypothetical protein